ncbi:hypothetical protein FRB99_002130 [Tulasnella sp. 403]|nr:hypothetical protein FRB99_002130 [Tulasnella sp. 403]
MPTDRFVSESARESALQLITRSSRITDPPGPTFISALDDFICRASLQNSSTGESTLEPGNVIEIQSLASAGKTQVLFFFAMTTVLPHVIAVLCTLHASTDGGRSTATTSRSVLLGGRGKSVVVCDCDGRWVMRRLQMMLSSYISAKLSQAFENTEKTLSDRPHSARFLPCVDDLVAEALGRVHIFRPTSSTSLAATLRSLPTFQRLMMPGQQLLMLLVDSISSFHHADRWMAEERGKNDGCPNMRRTIGVGTKGGRTPMSAILLALQDLRQTLGAVIILSNWALTNPEGTSVNHAKYDNDKPWFGQHLSPPYPSDPSVTLRPDNTPDCTDRFSMTWHITLPGTDFAIEPFPPSMTFGQVVGDEERIATVEDFKVLALVRKLPSRLLGENGAESVNESIGAFEFGISSRLVSVD